MTHDHFKNIMSLVASHLSDWTFYHHPDREHDPVGSLRFGLKELWVSLFNGRLTIRGVFPKSQLDGYMPRHESCSITVAASRSCKSIAGDIRRRLLPKYLPEFNTTINEIDRHEIWVNRQRGIMTRLAKAAGTDITCWSGERTEKGRVIFGSNGCRSVIEMYGRDNVKMELSGVSPEVAEKIIELCQEE